MVCVWGCRRTPAPELPWPPETLGWKQAAQWVKLCVGRLFLAHQAGERTQLFMSATCGCQEAEASEDSGTGSLVPAYLGEDRYHHVEPGWQWVWEATSTDAAERGGGWWTQRPSSTGHPAGTAALVP